MICTMNLKSTNVNPNRTYSDSDKLLVEDNPREEIDERDVGGEQGHHLGTAQVTKGVNVEVVGQDPQKTEQDATTQKFA